ncbi:MAG: methylmalonyl-CoA mutase small subunit [Rhodospirillales bacterium]|nr:methylmalonyl-CoA mutase small subunit [Rhodospirillales bacterium]
MTNQEIKFADGFSMPTHEQWVAEVEKALKGAPFDKRMYTKTYEGVTLKPIYTRQDWPSAGDPSGFPGAAPFTRGAKAAGTRVDNWDMRQTYAYPDPSKCNDIILNELSRGVTSVTVRFDAAASAGLDVDAAGAAGLAGDDGVMVYTLDDLDRLLTGVYLDLIAVSLEAGAQFLPAAAMLQALWTRRRVAPEAAKGAFNADPLATLAKTGSLPTGLDAALAQMADLARQTAATLPQVTAVGVDTSAYHSAGATESQDLAASMATAIVYLKAMMAAGLDVDTACRQILFTYSVPCDQFLAISKLRAARKIWARIAEACGASETARGMKLNAVTASRMMSKRDPWVNMLRTTVACFAAAVAGADSITVQPFGAALGLADELGRRIARNTQVILAEESNLAKVIDPAGGSWYVESRTDDLAQAAWAEFQAIEKAGGMASVIADGSFAGKIAAAFAEREVALSKRRDPLTGVSEFPNILEAPLDLAVADAATALKSACERLPKARADGEGAAKALAGAKPGAITTAAVLAASAGATIGQMAEAMKGETTSVDPLPHHRLAERFEALRDAADAFKQKTGSLPKIFLANLGSVAQHTGRATFAKNFFEVAGIEAIGNAGFGDVESCVAAFKDSGATIAILCSADPVYETMAVPTAEALKASGCAFLFLAGNPGDKRQTYAAAGVDDFIFMGGDLLKTTQSALAFLGVI